MIPQDIAAVPAGWRKVTFAKHQPEYLPLPGVISDDGCLYTEWKPDEAELARLVAGEAVRLWIWTFNQPLQPVMLTVTDGD